MSVACFFRQVFCLSKLLSSQNGQSRLSGIDRQELLSWSIQTLMAAAGQAMQQKNPGAVVACIRQLDHMTGTGYNSHRGYGTHRRSS